jgi:hypothetical protein
MVVFRAAVASMFILLGACSVGEVPIGGNTDGGGGVGGQTFETMVKPLVTKCIGCHSAAQGPTLTSFATLQAKYKVKPGASNILVTKADATQGVHQAVDYFSAVEKKAVGDWIDSLP